MKPTCHNRPPRAAGTWERTGREVLCPIPIWNDGPGGDVALISKPVLRWRWTAFADRCATHDGRGIGPNGESYPQAHGWDCTGCRWLPEVR